MVNFYTIGLGLGTLIIGSVLTPVILAFSPADSITGLFISLILILAGLYLLYAGARGNQG